MKACGTTTVVTTSLESEKSLFDSCCVEQWPLFWWISTKPILKFQNLYYLFIMWTFETIVIFKKSLVFGISCICRSLKQTYSMICLDVAEHSIGSHWMGWENTTWHDESLNPFAYTLQLWFCWNIGCMRRTNIYGYVKGQRVHILGWVGKEIRFCGFSYKEIFPQKVSVLGQADFLIKDSHDSRG